MPSTPDLDPLLDEAPAGFLVVDDNGVVERANATLATMLGRDRAAIEGHHIDVFTSPPARIFYSTHLFPLLRLHGHAEELYLAFVHGNGAELPMMVNGLARGEGDARRYHLVLVPMRQRNELETQLIEARNAAQEALAAKDRFLSVVSHELRSPLAGISGYADLLLRERRGSLTADQRRYAERIRDAANQQAALITDILDFAALGNRRELAVDAIGVEDVLTRAEALLTLRASDDQVRLDRKPRPATGSVLGDAGAVQQILLNLGTNALKYGREGGWVEIRVDRDDQHIRIHVRDGGPGIPADQLERIFEAFVQLATVPTSPSQRGVGLGLAISRELARAMGGEVTVASEVGQGSTFTLELPAA